MNKKMWLCIITPILIIYFWLGYIRGIEITVVDAITKQPLERVLVYYMLEAGRSEFLAFNGPDYRRLETKEMITDKNGKVYIKPLFFVKNFAESFKETIAINMDTNEINFYYVEMKEGKFNYIRKSKNDDPAYNFFSHHAGHPFLEDEKNMVFNPKNEYNGFILFSTEDFSFSGNNEFEKYYNYSFYKNNNSIKRLFKEKFTVYLESNKK